jgi:hypothetical protein
MCGDYSVERGKRLTWRLTLRLTYRPSLGLIRRMKKS